MIIKLYRRQGRENIINKGSWLYDETTLTGELRDSMNLTNPEVIVDISSTSSISGSTQAINDLRTGKINRFNYVYIPDFERYYFVRDITVLRKNIYQLSLHCDVLYSFKDVIYAQRAYISRSESDYDITLPDERRVIKNTFTVSEFTPSNVDSGSLVNTTFQTSFRTGIDDKHIVAYVYQLSAPSIEGTLSFVGDVVTTNPDIDYKAINDSFNAAIGSTIVMSNGNAGEFVGYLFNHDTKIGFVGGVYAYPFTIPLRLQVKDEQGVPETETIRVDGTTTPAEGVRLLGTLSDELVIADFVVNPIFGDFVISDFNDLEPYAKYELYIPYYGWWEFPYNELLGKRILIYYIVNFKDGTAVVQVYNKTDGIIVLSNQCQLGVEIEKSSSNLQEVLDKKRQNDLNITLGLVSTALSIGTGIVTGIATGNPLAIGAGIIAGGMSATKTIASHTETERTNYRKAFIGNNGNVTPLFAYQNIKIRKTKRDIQYPVTSEFLKLNGGICNMIKTIGTLTGYFEVADIQFTFNINYPNPTTSETNEIVTLLKSGVVF